MNGIQIYDLATWCEQMHYLGYSRPESDAIVRSFWRTFEDDHDGLMDALQKDLVERRKVRA